MLPNNKSLKKERLKKWLHSFLDFINKSKRKRVGSSRELSEEVTSDINSSKLEESSVLKELGKKTILLIGSTGKGKSTLANVISNTNKFKESGGSTSETREIQKEVFTESDIDYAIIDTVGLSDTKVSRNEVLDKIAEAVYLSREGISQVLFVIDGRFDQKEIANYDLLRTIIFDDKIVDYTTIVRTRFESFENKEKRKDDIVSMLKESKELKEIITSCQQRIIHVNNPSLNLIPASNEDKSRREKREDKITSRKESRKASRECLIEHLKKVCQNGFYKPEKLKQLSSEIVDYMEDKIKKREELQEKNKVIGLQEVIIEDNKFSQKIATEEDTTPNQNSEIIESTVKSDSENYYQEAINKNNKDKKLSDSSKKESIKSQITRLENELKELEGNLKELEEAKQLKTEIQEIEESIRQTVKNHILNNRENIGSVTGGNIFLNLIENDNNSSISEQSISKLQKNKTQLEQKLQKKKDGEKDLEIIEKRIKQTRQKIKNAEKRLLESKKQLLRDREISEQWQKQHFTTQEARIWADALDRDFNPETGVNFCAWLRDDKQLTAGQIKEYLLEELKSQYIQWLESQVIGQQKVNLVELKDWTAIHPNFAGKPWGSNKTYQQCWEDYDITYSEAQEWIKIDFKVDDYYYVKGWKRYGFNSQTADKWLKIGLRRGNYELAAYVRGKGYRQINWWKLREEYDNWKKQPQAQEYLDAFYPPQIRKNIKELDISWENLTGSLVIEGSGWPNLKDINMDINQLDFLTINNCQQLICLKCNNNQLTNLELANCIQLLSLECYENQLTNLTITKCPKLTKLWAKKNKLTDLSIFSSLVSLERLLSGDNDFTGSLEPLKNLKTLRILDIRATFTTGLEYLPESLEYLYCHANQFPELTKYEKWSDYYDYQAWRRDNQELITKTQQELQLITQLSQLKNEAQAKLITNPRIEQLWSVFLTNAETLTIAEQELLEEKLIAEFLTQYQQIQMELTQVKSQLAELRSEIQAQIQAPSKGSSN